MDTTKMNKELVVKKICEKVESEGKRAFGVNFSEEAINSLAQEAGLIDRKRKVGTIPTKKGAQFVNVEWKPSQEENEEDEVTKIQEQIAELQKKLAKKIRTN